jgi:hypothetical protein
VRVFTRPFDSHAGQWSFAVFETGISTNWILRLDADYQLSNEIIEEFRQINLDNRIHGYRIRFKYSIFGVPLRTSLYPPNTILLKRGFFSVSQRGHTESWFVRGEVANLRGVIVHDDWKSTSHFVLSQSRYMIREHEALGAEGGGLKAWLRRHPPLMPAATIVYVLFLKGLILNGRAGVYYALQRLLAELILSLMILEQHVRSSKSIRALEQRRHVAQVGNESKTIEKK